MINFKILRKMENQQQYMHIDYHRTPQQQNRSVNRQQGPKTERRANMRFFFDYDIQ